MRAGLEAALAARARAGPPLLVAGPPGGGKTTLLLAVAARLRQEGMVPVYLDLFGAASSPERFVDMALRALPAESFGAHLPEALAIRSQAQAGRSQAAGAVTALFRLWSTLNQAQGRPVVLLFDEVTEIRSLAYFKGLREAHTPFAAALAARRSGTLLATSFPTAARRLLPFEVLALPALTADDLRPAAGAMADAIARASFGWPRYARVLLECEPRSHEEVGVAWAREMALGGRLELLARATHEALLLRSRGYGISKAVLQAVAEAEGANLTALVPRVGRTPGAVRDYLQWLVGVDAIRMVKKRYTYVDGMLRAWVHLHGRGLQATRAEIEAVARAVVLTEPADVKPAAAAEEPERAALAKRDSLIEID